MKRGKKYLAAMEKIEPQKKYALDEAISKLKEIAFAKFDETVELTMWLGVDPRKADQLVRGTIVLPNGLGGKSKHASSSLRKATKLKKPKKPVRISQAATNLLTRSKAAGSISMSLSPRRI